MRVSIPVEKFYESPANMPDSKKGTRRKYDLPPAANLAARLRAGETLEHLAEEFGYEPSSVRRRLNKAGYDFTGGKLIPQRPEVMCGWCGGRTHAPTAVCQNCSGIEVDSRREPTEAHALTGGHWAVNERGIQVWVLEDDQADIRPTTTDCRKCGATGNDPCHTKGGGWAHDHAGRHRERFPARKPDTLTPDAMMRGHSQYTQGIRTEFSITAHRQYKRLHQRQQRAARAAQTETAA